MQIVVTFGAFRGKKNNFVSGTKVRLRFDTCFVCLTIKSGSIVVKKLLEASAISGAEFIALSSILIAEMFDKRVKKGDS